MKEVGRASKWGGRLEFYLTDPSKELNPDRWQAEVLYRIKDAK